MTPRLLDTDHHAQHYGGDATPAVRCSRCHATGMLRLVGGRFVCRSERGCVDRATKRRRALRRLNGWGKTA